MKLQVSAVLLFIIFLLPGLAQAKVYISEVAWMGNVDNANAEWIELYNDGPATSVEGWTLAAADGQPSLTLAGALPANSYALLERTSDETVPSVRAFLIYTGALGNSGETLELYTAEGVLEDRVRGGEDWELGGDNETKDTLQRSGEPALGGFITAPPTPGIGGGVAAVREEGDASPNMVAEPRETRPKQVTPSTFHEPALTLVLDEVGVVTTGVPIRFTARALRESGREVLVDSVSWVFGDGAVGRGREVSHAYTYPGTYAVVVHAEDGSFRTPLRADARMSVEVVAPRYAITEANEEYVEITNTGEHVVDLTDHALAVGEDHFFFPEGTQLLAGSSVRFPMAHTHLTVHEGQYIGLYTPSRTLAHLYRAPNGGLPKSAIAHAAQSEQESRAVGAAASAPAASSVVTDVDSDVGIDVDELLRTVERPNTLGGGGAAVAEASAGLEAASQPQEQGRLLWWLAALAALIGTTLVVIALIRYEEHEIVRGYEIEEG